MGEYASTSSQGQFVNVVRGFAAGGIAAAISKTTVAPMDRVKLVLQLQNGHSVTVHAGGNHAHPQYQGIIDCFRKLTAEQGVRSLWRGNCASVIRCFPSHALNFAFRDYYRMVFLGGVDRRKNRTRHAIGQFSVKVLFLPGVLGNIAAGGAGGATTLCILYPLDFMRTRLAVDMQSDGHRQFAGIRDCLTKIHAKEGLAGLYRGFFASLQFVVASRAVFFGIFDTMRTSISDDPRQLSFLAMWGLAQVCIVTSSIICYPLDTVRRRLMMQSGKKVKLYENSFDCWRTILRTEGASSLYKGALSNSLRCTSGALILAIYYEVVKYF
ncbi:Protein R07E3.4 [Aphelenchoides avenae]|nr:Protein R07E3.4 [Aphelenchus avenae]